MADSKWGSYTIYVQKCSFDEGTNYIEENAVIPDPTDLTTSNTILSGAGFDRTKVSVSGYCSSTVFGYLISDRKAYTQRNLELCNRSGTKIIDLNMRINKLSGSLNIAEDNVYFDCDFIEG